MELRAKGASAAEALDFDYGMIDFDRWYQARVNETVWVKPDTSHEGRVPEPKYSSVQEILSLYSTTADPYQPVFDQGMHIDIDTLAAEAFADAPPQF